MKRLAFLLLFAALSVTAADNGRIAAVDLERVFREYYKSRIAEDSIKQQAEVYRNYLLQLNEQLTALREEARVARLNSQNIALADADRRKSMQAAETKAREVRQKEAEIDLYASEGSESMRKVETEKRKEIMTEIMAEARRRMTAEGYAFLFDTSGKTMNEQPTLLVFPPGCDLTESMIRELNRGKTKPVEAAK